MSLPKKLRAVNFIVLLLIVGLSDALTLAGCQDNQGPRKSNEAKGNEISAPEAPALQAVPEASQTKGEAESTKLLPIIVCAKACSKGTILTRENLAYKEYEERYLPTHGFSDELMVIGRPLLVDKGPGEMIFLEDVITKKALTAGKGRLQKMANDPIPLKD
jgi:hypothetical protein